MRFITFALIAALWSCTPAPASQAIDTAMNAVEASEPKEEAKAEAPQFYIPIVSDIFKAFFGPHDGKPANAAQKPTIDASNDTDKTEPPYQFWTDIGLLAMIAAPFCFVFVTPKVGSMVLVGGASSFFISRWLAEWVWVADVIGAVVLGAVAIGALYAAWLHRDDIWRLLMHNNVFSGTHPKKKKKK